MNTDRVFFAGLAILAVGLIALAMIWPQGYGDRSPGPFGHTPIQQTPEMKAAMQREHDGAMRRQEQARRQAAGEAPLPAPAAPSMVPNLRPAQPTTAQPATAQPGATQP